MTYKLASKEEILAKVAEKNRGWFSRAEFLEGTPEFTPRYGDPGYEEYQKRLKADQLTPDEKAELLLINTTDPVEDWNMGDGHAAYKTYHFPQYDLYVSLVGYYSSYGDSEWDEVFVSEPYEYKEIRYREKA